MHPAYKSETIPWYLFLRHVQITSSDKSEFALQGSSTMEARDADFTVLAGSLAAAIADDAERRRSTVPKPNASIQAWKDLGVDDDALFPDEYLSRVAGMHHPSAIVPDPHKYVQKATWGRFSRTIGDQRAVPALLVVVMTEPPNQFQFLAVLLRLAQSIKINLAALAGFHYSLPPRRSYEEDYDKGIVAYINLTLSNFLLVNIILAVAQERDCYPNLLRLARRSQVWDPPLATDHNGNALDAANFEDRLHHEFWRSLSDGPRPTQAELLEKMHHYSSRCFNFLVSWYAVMTESFFTARALDRTYPVYFGPKQLTAVILLQLQNLGSAFNVHSLDASDPVAFVRHFNTLSSFAADLTAASIGDRGTLPVAPVPFLSLPPELHLHILSYLPTRALLSIMGVCTQMRKVCPELIYMNPTGIIDDFHPLYHNYFVGDPGVADVMSRRFSKLLALLLAQPQLFLRLRTFTLRACGVPEGPSISHSNYGLNINDPIVERMINLSHLDLCIPHPICAKCAARGSSWCKERLECIIPDLIRRWPCLRALTISYLRRDAVLDHDTPESSEAPRCIEPANRNPSWSLQSLEVKQSDWERNVPPAGQQDRLPLYHLVQMSAHTLRRLELHPHSLGALGDLGMFPICPLVEHFSIRSALTGPMLKIFLKRCFPAITFLHVSFDTTFADFTILVENFGRLDLSECKLLRRAAVDLYPISGFPPCVESLDLGIGFNVNHIWATSHTMKAVHLSDKVTYFEGPDGDQPARVVFGSLGRAFPDLYCLDIGVGNDGVKDKDNMMNTLSSIVSGSLPNLRILILTICHGLLCFRLRRSDFPSDDGGDRRQHDYAVVFFRACPSLNIISFNGAPFEDAPAFIQPDRVWKRATVDGEVEAQMTGSESLPWKIGQSRRIDQSKNIWLG